MKNKCFLTNGSVTILHEVLRERCKVSSSGLCSPVALHEDLAWKRNNYINHTLT